MPSQARLEYLDRLRTYDGREDLTALEYFQFCLASHYATVATFVPTDVDSKIRGILWREAKEPEALRSMCDYAISAARWDLTPVSKRVTVVAGAGEVSGHNGEWLGVLAGAHGRFLSRGDAEYAEMTAAAIDAELSREAVAFRKVLNQPGAELDALRLAASLTHNCGDLDQGISFWSQGEATREPRGRFHRLAHENRTPYGGTVQVAAQLYKEAMSTEGHRNYPLRAVRALRRSADLLLPLGPFLDEWGGIVATHPALTAADHREFVEALVLGCRKLAGQRGYFRALAGFEEANPRAYSAAVEGMPTALRRDLREFRKEIAVPRVSFESSFRKTVARVRSAARLEK